MDHITEDYRTLLADLTYDSKPLIDMLTMFAEDNEIHAAKIVKVIETHLERVESTKKLPTLYLIDSIIKNLPTSTYPGLFSYHIVSIFCNMFEQVDKKTRQCMFKVRQTWDQHFTGRKMYALDVRVNNIDHAWPLSTPTFNPKFLPQQRYGSLPLPDLPPIENEKEEMRRQLRAYEDLPDLMHEKLELEWKETETPLAKQKKYRGPSTEMSRSRDEAETAYQLGEALSRYDETGLADMEDKLISSLVNNNRGKGTNVMLKDFFNYLLLDPRITQNLPDRMNLLGDEESFKVFVEGIFYVGKGKGIRPRSHLSEAFSLKKKTEAQDSNKLRCIRDIWSENVGVVILYCFQNVISDEALTREACMIDAIGVTRLTNVRRGSYKGISDKWGMETNKNMGIYFLKKAFQIFKGEGEKQIFPDDIKVRK